MLRKSFVSIFIFPERLQVLQLDSKKRFVKKRSSLNLPPGLITNHSVKDKKALSDIIRALWRSMGLSKKSVGIIVPEFSTFAKNLVIPNLEIKELDEAVRWQVQDFLPGGIEMVVDWKIVGETTEGYKILVVAIPRDVLAGYVDAVGLAGLYPVMVETPSLSLVRISGKEKSGKLIIFGGFGEVTLVVAEGENILGSSVINTGNDTDIAQTAFHIVKHYKAINVEQVLIGGSGFSQNLLSELSHKIGKKVDWIRAGVGGVTPQESQEYLIPISSQLKDPTEPRDETTINLLPPDWVKAYSQKRIKSQLVFLSLTVTAVMAGCLWATLGTNFAMQQKLTSLKSQINSQGFSVSQKAEELTEEISRINSVSSKVDKIVSSSSSPTKIIDTVNNLKPSGVRISEYSLEIDAGKISLKGSAASRQDLVNFRKSLEDHPNFSKVQVPVSSLEKEIDLEFDLRFVYGTEVIKTGTTKLKPN